MVQSVSLVTTENQAPDGLLPAEGKEFLLTGRGSISYEYLYRIRCSVQFCIRFS
jgi:hypothetical protein